MRISLRITRELLNEIHADLSRRHPFAFERVGFVSCTVAERDQGGILLLAAGLHPVADSDYERDTTVGAMLGPGAFRKALQCAFAHPVAMFHVHRHEHMGWPAFSQVDVQESARFVPDFWKVRPGLPHGTLLLSHDSMTGIAWLPQTRKPVPIFQFGIVGNPTIEIEHGH